MLSEEKFFEKSEKFALYPTVDEKFYTYEELHNKIKAKQTDKDDKLVILYSSSLMKLLPMVMAGGYTNIKEKKSLQ